MTNPAKGSGVAFSRRLQQIIDQSLGNQGWSAGIAPDRLFLAILSDKGSHGSLIVNSLMRDWELHRVVDRMNEAIGTPGPRGLVTLRGATALADYIAERLAVVYGDDLPPVINTGHAVLAMLNDRRLFASRLLGLYSLRPADVFQYLMRLPSDEQSPARPPRSS